MPNMGNVVSVSSTKSKPLLVSEMHGDQMTLHSIIAVLIVADSDGVGDKR
jgi:hypothetical protein